MDNLTDKSVGLLMSKLVAVVMAHAKATPPMRARRDDLMAELSRRGADAVPLLLAHVSHHDAAVSADAATILGWIAPQDITDALTDLLYDAQPEHVKRSAAAALTTIATEASLAAVAAWQSDRAAMEKAMRAFHAEGRGTDALRERLTAIALRYRTTPEHVAEAWLLSVYDGPLAPEAKARQLPLSATDRAYLEGLVAQY